MKTREKPDKTPSVLCKSRRGKTGAAELRKNNSSVNENTEAVKNPKEIRRKKIKIAVIVIVIVAVLLFSFLLAAGNLIGLRGTYVSVDDPNEFYSFVLGAYDHYSAAGNDDNHWDGKWKKEDNTITLDGGEGKISYLRAPGQFDDVFISGREYKRVSLIWYKFLQYKKSVNFVSNGGTSGQSTVNLKIGDHVQAPKAPTRDGYIFRGWFTSVGGYQNHAVPFRSNDRIWKNTVLYANWSSNTEYAVKNTDCTGSDVTVHEGDPLLKKLKDAETTDLTYGYLMSRAVGAEHWTAVTEFTYAPAYDIKVKRADAGIPRDVKVEFDLNGGSVAAGVKTEVTKKCGESINMFDACVPVPTRENYNFAGWSYTDKDGVKTTYYSKSDSFKVPAGNPIGRVTLVAEWNEKALVTFDAGGGIGKLQTEPIFATTGDKFRLPNCDFIFRSHSFIGWSDGKRIYRFNEYYIASSPTVSFTAVWVDDSAAFTRINDLGVPSANGDYVVFGKYPQNKKPLHVKVSASPDADGYYSGSDGAQYVKMYCSTSKMGKLFADGSNITDGTSYYFRVSPLVWRVLDDNDTSGRIAITSKLIIDTKSFVETNQEEDELTGDIYASDWEHSYIRAWLNDEENGFLSKLNLSAAAKALIDVHSCDNRTTAVGGSNNIYAVNQSDTKDKAFLFSHQNFTAQKEYEFSLESEGSRRMYATDYARCCGVQFDNTTGYGRWWTRSADNSNGENVTYVNAAGSILQHDVKGHDLGIVPVMWICASKY